MTSRRRAGAPGSAADAEQVLDQFVSSFEWSIPTRFKLVDTEPEPRYPDAVKPLLAYAADYPPPRVHPGPGLLEGFLKLESASNEAILAYARQWGPLWLCGKHNLPYRHAPGCEPDYDDDLNDDHDDEPFDDDYELVEQRSDRRTIEAPWLSERSSPDWYVEYLFAWRDLSRQMRATVRIARRLHDGQLGQQSDWDSLPFLTQPLVKLVAPSCEDSFSPVDQFERADELERELLRASVDPHAVAAPLSAHSDLALDSSVQPGDPYLRLVEAAGRVRLSTSLEFQRRALSEVLNYWLGLGGARPQLEWSGPKPQVQLGGHGMMGALAVQLLFDCSRTDGLAVCTSCGTPFLPGGRRPRRDRNAYCSDCGLKAAARDAAARYRQTQKYKQTYQKWLGRRRR